MPSHVMSTHYMSLFRNAGELIFLKKIKTFFIKINIFYILNYFDVLILKITFKKYIKNYFNIFQYEKYFEK